MIALRMTALYFIAALGQWWLSTYLRVGSLSPQLLLVLTVVAAARQGPVAAMCFGFAWGLCMDVYSIHLVGGNSLALTLVGYGVGTLRRQVDVSSIAPASVIILGVSWGYFLLIGTLGLLFLKHFLWSGWIPFLFDPVINCVMAPALFWLWDAVVER